MKLLFILSISISLAACDVDHKKIKVPPPPKMKTRMISADTAKRVKLAQIRAQLVEVLKKKP